MKSSHNHSTFINIIRKKTTNDRSLNLYLSWIQELVWTVVKFSSSYLNCTEIMTKCLHALHFRFSIVISFFFTNLVILRLGGYIKRETHGLRGGIVTLLHV